MSSLWLKNHKKDINSQCGDDGVIQAIFDKIGVANRWCCEFGAYDGKTLSNTRALIDQGWKGVMIEPSDDFHTLVKNMKDYPVTCMQEYVGTNLDELLSRTLIPADFDLLSIDTDNESYYTWETLKNYKPRVVDFEVNAFYSADEWHTPDMSALDWTREGTSIAPAVELAKSKGYELAICCGWNALFVLREYVDVLGIDTVNWKSLFGYPHW